MTNARQGANLIYVMMPVNFFQSSTGHIKQSKNNRTIQKKNTLKTMFLYYLAYFSYLVVTEKLYFHFKYIPNSNVTLI